MTKYVLPDLPYDYAALEPHLSGALMETHHGRHHKAYVDGANRAIEELLEARHAGDFAAIPVIERKMAFNVSGHVLHSLFWSNLSPEGGGRPSGELSQLFDRDFGGFDRFRRQMSQLLGETRGSGWALLVWDPLLRRLGTTLVHDHQDQVSQGSLPLLALDAWEHAYYSQYKADKAAYIDALWNIVRWADVEARFASVRNVDLLLPGTATGVEPVPSEVRH